MTTELQIAARIHAAKRDESHLNIGYQTAIYMRRVDRIRSIWVARVFNRFTGERTSPLVAYVMDDFGNLSVIRDIDTTYADAFTAT